MQGVVSPCIALVQALRGIMHAACAAAASMLLCCSSAMSTCWAFVVPQQHCTRSSSSSRTRFAGDPGREALESFFEDANRAGRAAVKNMSIEERARLVRGIASVEMKCCCIVLLCCSAANVALQCFATRIVVASISRGARASNSCVHNEPPIAHCRWRMCANRDQHAKLAPNPVLSSRNWHQQLQLRTSQGTLY